MMDKRNFLGRQIKKHIRAYRNITNICICQGNDYTTGCLLDYPYFKED